MPRFEMYLFIVESDGGRIESTEAEVICWVKNSNDIDEIKDVANKVIAEKIKTSERVIMFGTAMVKVRGEDIMDLGFRNNDLDPDEVNSVISLITAEEGSIH